MKLLAIDTSTDYLSLAVTDGGKVIARFHRKIGRNHSSLLIPMIDTLLKKARLKLKDIAGFAISIGPGSFTGLRIGVATVKGLSLATGKPIVAVPTLDAVARNAGRFKGAICPVLDARKNKLYACIYESDGKTVKRRSKYLLIPAPDLLEKIKRYDKIFFLGDGATLLGKKAGKADWYPRAEIVARLGLEDFKKRKFVKAEDLEPLYIYSKECDIIGK